MNLKDWEKTLYNITKNTGDIRTMMQYIKVAKYNEKTRRNELKDAQTEIYKDDENILGR